MINYQINGFKVVAANGQECKRKKYTKFCKNLIRHWRLKHFQIQNICTDNIAGPDRKKRLLPKRRMLEARCNRQFISWPCLKSRKAVHVHKFNPRASLLTEDIWAHIKWPGSRKHIGPGETKNGYVNMQLDVYCIQKQSSLQSSCTLPLFEPCRASGVSWYEPHLICQT